ncbi:hypothetical protein PPL_07800 [Heterostelium album PN500]|uniref:MACPF domain-containing protein n=1 Tax=Heterostelium pallidum (strain ATCC 26659 / Pp 5 / PN500) TaxID=670386 RepID=D3BGZ8_HETP5|nr:hypothetical protein PPL_07800 [Heterostelium album PN500]EFA79382.1 hypothetical protein PPL_07800 [Heterostelium album PN500]|eukprot:XP_020431503.1 hypothetical protein PPL_07800 [Heterostelium album PN500]
MDLWFAEASLQLAFSLDVGVQFAGGFDSTVSGSIASTKFKCEIYKVHNNDPKFHPKFIQDISKVESVDDMMKYVKKYGIFYKETATLGGTLEQISKVSQVNFASRSSNSLDINLALSFAAQASGFGMKGGGNLAASLTASTSEAKQNGFEKTSSFSRIIVKGGSPGSYGSNVANPIQSWAENLDLLPMPIDYKVKYVVDLIPDSWFIASGLNVKQLWRDAQRKLYVGKFAEQPNSFYDDDTLTTIGKTEGLFIRQLSFLVTTYTGISFFTSDGTKYHVREHAFTGRMISNIGAAEITNMESTIKKPDLFINTQKFISSSDCYYQTKDGNFFDFTGLIKYGNDNFVSKYQDYTVYFNLCGVSQKCNSLESRTDSQACKITADGTKVYSLGLNTKAEVSPIADGLSLKYTGAVDASSCGAGKARIVTYNFLCDMTGIGFVVGDLVGTSTCQYEITIKSSYACPTVRIYDVFTGRFYRMRIMSFLTDTKVLMATVNHPPNHIQVRIKFETDVWTGDSKIVFRLYTEFETLEATRYPSEIPGSGLISFDPTKYPGDLLGLSIDRVVGSAAADNRYSLKVRSVLAMQQCPDKDKKITSDCVSKKVLSIENGYARAFVSPIGNFEYKNDEKPVFVPLNLYGISSSYAIYE